LVHQRDERYTLDVFWLFDASEVEESSSIIKIECHFILNGSSLDQWWVSHQKRSMKSWLIHESLIKETVLTQEEALVSCINDESIVKFT